jgi:hypothetical protein
VLSANRSDAKSKDTDGHVVAKGSFLAPLEYSDINLKMLIVAKPACCSLAESGRLQSHAK